jgi:hypothetical protein
MHAIIMQPLLSFLCVALTDPFFSHELSQLNRLSLEASAAVGLGVRFFGSVRFGSSVLV